MYSAADDKVFGQLAKCPDSKKHPHAARWFRHIQSWKDGGDGSAVAKKGREIGQGYSVPESCGDPAVSTKNLLPNECGIMYCVWIRCLSCHDKRPFSISVTYNAIAAADDDDDVDLFGSDDEEEESEEAKRIREERLAAYHAKKSKKPTVIAKTSVLLDCKPWDDETDMNAMLKEVKKIQMDGLVWGASKLVPVGYGINKLQVMCVVEDEKVSIDELQEKICDLEDYVQSCDVAAMNKI